MSTYCYKTHLPIMHHASAPNARLHSHSLELAVHVRQDSDDLVPFGDIERYIQICLDSYKGKVLNDMPEFSHGADIEDIGDLLFEYLKEVFIVFGIHVTRVELGESPLRMYFVGTE